MKDPDASNRAGIQKRAKNLTADELFIEVMKNWGWDLLGEIVGEHPNHIPDKYIYYSWIMYVRLR